jgi:hypothetical protein
MVSLFARESDPRVPTRLLALQTSRAGLSAWLASSTRHADRGPWLTLPELVAEAWPHCG